MSGSAQRAEGGSDCKVSFDRTNPIPFSGQDVLTRQGVEFIDENGGGPGVRLRKSNDAKLKKK